jgi:NAD dependent epimerase/dehydratase
MNNNKVLVTGADGFIGSHLVELLVAKGYKVKALAQYNSFNHWGWLEDITCKDQVEIICGDIRDPHFCRHITKNVDMIFHLAALIAIPYSYIAPESYVSTNVTGTLNICQAALDKNVSRIIHTSTSEVYGTAQYVPIDEKHPLQAQSPYSASKIGADAMAMSYFNAFDLPLTIARPFNTYGPRQSARAVIPTIISQIANGEKQIKLGDVSPTRDFNYVEDTCRGFLALAENQSCIGETINIGSNYEISVGDTLRLIKEIMGSDVEFILDEQRIRPEKSEVNRLWCDNTKMNKLTNFTPQYDLKT